MFAESSENGVYYQASDYIGTWKRVFIDMVDVLVASTLSLTVTLGVLLITNEDHLAIAVLVVWIAVWFSYFVLLKRSIRTVGYILARARIVNLQGKTPSIASLFLRLLFALLGPMNLLFDLVWIPSDPSRQALRDKFAHTYVIKRFAFPAGSGRIGYVPYTILGASYIFQEVKRPKDGPA